MGYDDIYTNLRYRFGSIYIIITLVGWPEGVEIMDKELELLKEIEYLNISGATSLVDKTRELLINLICEFNNLNEDLF